VSIAHAGPGPQTVPDAYTFPDDLLIRGFGVQVPGGAPVLTWPYSSRAIRLLSSWGMDGSFLGHTRAHRRLVARPRNAPEFLALLGFELRELTSGSSRTR
jgi:hypothetical protein